jgi:DNA-binding NtrC family response regulator
LNAHAPLPERARHIVVADEDPKVATFVVETLRADCHALFHAYDTLSATELAMAALPCDLVICDAKVQGEDAAHLIQTLRRHLRAIRIIYIANIGRSTPALEAQLPPDVPILREPFMADELRAVVNAKFNGRGDRGSPDRA